MSIIFEPIPDGSGDGATAMPIGALGSNRTGNYGFFQIPLGVGGTGVQTGTGTAAIPMPFAAFGADVFNIGHPALPLEVSGYGSSISPPAYAIGAVGMPLGVAAHGYTIYVGHGVTALPLSVFGADVNSLGHISMPLSAHGADVVPSRFASLYQFPTMYISMLTGVRLQLHDEFIITPYALLAKLSMQLRTVLGIADGSPRMSELIKRLDDSIGLHAVIAAAMRVRATTGIGLHPSLSVSDLMILALSDSIGLLAAPGWTQETDRLLAAIFALLDVSDGAQLAQTASSIGLTYTLSNEILVYAQALTTLRLNALLTGDLLLTAVMSSTIGMHDALTTVSEVLAALSSAIGIMATLQLADGAYTAWVMNAESKAVWTYDNYPFNSFAQLGDRYYGAGPDGLSELVGDDDAGTAINWSARTGVTNFGTQLEKRGVMAYVGYTSAGDVGLSVIVTEPGGEKVQYNYHMIPRNAADTTVNRIEIGKGLQSVYWQFEFVGTGAFSLDTASVLPMILSRRI